MKLKLKKLHSFYIIWRRRTSCNIKKLHTTGIGIKTSSWIVKTPSNFSLEFPVFYFYSYHFQPTALTRICPMWLNTYVSDILFIFIFFHICSMVILFSYSLFFCKRVFLRNHRHAKRKMYSVRLLAYLFLA